MPTEQREDDKMKRYRKSIEIPKSRQLISAFLIISLLIAVGSHASPKPYNNPSESGLKQFSNDRFDFIYLKPGTNLGALKKVYIEEPIVEFDKQWIKDHRRDVNKKYMYKVKRLYSDTLKLT